MRKQPEYYGDQVGQKTTNRGMLYIIALLLISVAGLAGISLVISPCSNQDGNENIICGFISTGINENLIRTRVAEEAILTSVAQSTLQSTNALEILIVTSTLEVPITLIITATPQPIQAPEVIIVTATSSLAEPFVVPTTIQQQVESGCFCTEYHIPDTISSGCPGSFIETGHTIPPSSILRPSSPVNELWVYMDGGIATAGGTLWQYRTQMYGGGQPASRACVEGQFQYIDNGRHTPVFITR